MGPIGIQKRTGNIYNFLPSPLKHQPGFLGHHCNRNSFQIFFRCKSQKPTHIFRVYHYRHPLLGFGNSKLCSVKACVFLGNLIQVHDKTRGKFADCHGHASCAKIIALLDDPADLSPAEKTLDLTLCGCVSFLYFSAAGLYRAFRMYLRRSSSPAAAVASGSSPKKNDHVLRVRIFPDHISPRSCPHDCTDLHTLCHIIRMIDFFHITGCKANLVPVRGVTAGCPPD